MPFLNPDFFIKKGQINKSLTEEQMIRELSARGIPIHYVPKAEIPAHLIEGVTIKDGQLVKPSGATVLVDVAEAYRLLIL